ncbi:MAG: prolyl oligopeptidase family serine peptidase [Brumimicrobium sp.]
MGIKSRVILLVLLVPCFIFGQKKQLDHTVYNDWRSLKNQNISSNGNYISYEINPHEGDGFLYIYSSPESKKDSFPRGSNAQISHSEDILAFLIKPGFDTIRKLKLDEVKKEKWVKDSLGIYFTKQDSLVKIPNVVSYKIPQEGKWLAYSLISDSIKKQNIKEKKWFQFFKKKTKKEKTESKGNQLMLYNTETFKKDSIVNVTDYEFNKQGSHLFYITQKTIDKKDSFQISMLDLKKHKKINLEGSFTDVKNHSFSKKGTQLAFLASKDTVKENKNYELYHWNLKESLPVMLVDTNRSELNMSLRLSANQKPYFSLDDSKLYIGLEEKPKKIEEDSLLESEKAKLDVWHYKDKRLQPQQKKELKKDKKESFLSVIHLKSNELVQLGSDTLKVVSLDQGNCSFATGISNEQYKQTYNWTFPWPRDYYKINLQTGVATNIKSNVSYGMGLSPDGKYFIYFDPKEKEYISINTDTDEVFCVSCLNKDSINWQRDINGMPHDAGAYRIAGYTKSNKSLILHSEFDVWEFNFENKTLRSLTKKRGEQTNTELRLRRWNYDSTYIDLNDVYIQGYNKDTKDESIYGYTIHGNHSHITPLKNTPHKLLSIQKAKESTKVIYRKMNVSEYPDLYLTNVNFDYEEKISTTNPQQSDYIWPTVEKIEWTSYKGKELEGLIYKPEDFDSTKSYPMIVYFYELYNDRYNIHYIPKPTASIIYPTEYTSAGYVVFIPDVRYREGHPAKGAYDCIMSGTDEVLKKYKNIDSTRMGLQGQSWGGYQTAQLITMTNRYKAAMAGAPVSNMFSAYGGIRWGSGYNRQFQYEKTQSRIGKTIWEAPDLYIENSPLFGIPQIETPLLIMHNDGDGAVPWYQGIEMFVGMKRLGKPVWMLNYNGDEHNLMKNANRIDLSIRMRQFFDHYLQNQPAPKWLIEGVPAIEKGDDYGLEEYNEE